MSILNKFANIILGSQEIDDIIYEEISTELNSGIKHGGLWVKAIENSNGDNEKAKSLYIKYRVRSIKDAIKADRAEQINYENLLKEQEKLLKEQKELDDKNQLFNTSKILLTGKGYTVEQQGLLWVVKDKYGSIDYFEDLEKLYSYAASRT